MDTETYKKLHFDIEHDSFIRKQIKYDSVEDFEIRFPAVTMDFSTALSNTWLESVTGLLQKMFGPTATLSQKGHEALKKFCSVHYKGNVVKVSNVSAKTLNQLTKEYLFLPSQKIFQSSFEKLELWRYG
jgi:hypothetical protein